MLAKDSGQPRLLKFDLSLTYSKNRSLQLALPALLLAYSGAFSAACSNSGTGNQPPGTSAGAAGIGEAGADSGGSLVGTTEIVFVPMDDIELKPKERRVLTAQTIPAGIYPLRFALTGTDAADAVLDASEVLTDSDGTAHVTLIAPSKPTTFSVRASTPSAKQVVWVGVSVSASGFTSLSVLPSYSGPRKVKEWTATVSTRHGLTCSDLAGNPPPDGDLTKTAAPGKPLVLNVPIGVDLVVTVRAGHYVGGCANLPALMEGDGNQVSVYTSDRPLNLSATQLSLSFGATDPHPAFDKLLKASATLAENAMLGSAANDVEALLDDMRDSSPASSRDAFSSARTQNDWDYALASAFGKSAARRVRDPAQRWFSAGLLALDAPDALIGQLAPLRNGASFSPTAVGPVSPSSAGFPDQFPCTWSADSNDTLLLGTDLSWVPSRLLTALAAAPALLEFPQAIGPQLALSRAVDCALVGNVLSVNGVNPGSEAFAACDESCATNLCDNAVAAAWSRAQLSSGTDTASLSVTASGAAQVGDEAQATAVSGSWVGELKTAEGFAPVSGALTATASKL